MPTQIPSFYRVWFTVIDPLFSSLGVFGSLFTPASVLSSFSPTFANPPSIETTVLLDTLTGFYLALIFLQVVLLRARPTDLTVWRGLQAATLIVDICILAGMMRALSAQGRTDPSTWRAEEWPNMGITAGVAVIRSAFLLGVGTGEGTKPKRKSR